jgi:acyl-CoA reductase-like NAD-dependent aldehyde dehydrogenase
VPALLTGNAVLYKPSEFCPLTGKAVEDLFEKAGLPKGLFQSVIGAGQIGVSLCELPINGIYFTGSYPPGNRGLHFKILIKPNRIPFQIPFFSIASAM